MENALFLQTQGFCCYSFVTHEHDKAKISRHRLAYNFEKCFLFLFGLLFYVPVNIFYGHAGTLAVETGVKQYTKQTRIPYCNKTQVYFEGLSLMFDEALRLHFIAVFMLIKVKYKLRHAKVLFTPTCVVVFVFFHYINERLYTCSKK